MSDVRVTVAIATRDRPTGVMRCLDSLAAGHELPDETLVIDQGSDPATAVAALHAALPRLRLVTQARTGLSASRNLAAAEASGDVLAVTDDDCVPGPGWVAAIVSAFADDPSLAGVTGPMLPLGPEEPGKLAVSSRTCEVRVDHRRGVAPWVVGTGGNMAVRREWIERVGGWDERLGAGSRGMAGEDVALVDRLLAAGAVIRFEPAAVVRHERRSLASRRATRWSYGFGIGALCGILLHERQGRALIVLGRWLALRLRLGMRSTVGGRVGEGVEELRVLSGTAAGLVYGLRAGAGR